MPNLTEYLENRKSENKKTCAKNGHSWDHCLGGYLCTNCGKTL